MHTPEDVKLHSEAIRRVEDRYLKIVEEVQDYAIILLNNEGIIQNWNRGAESLKGYSSNEIIGKSFSLFYPESDRLSRLPQKLLQEAIDMGRVSHYGWRLRKDGSTFWANVVITSLHDDEGEVIGFLKVTRDLTEQLIAQQQLNLRMEELRKSEERYHQMIDEVEDYAIILLDPDGKIQNWNKGAEKIKGYSSEEIIGKSFELFYSADDTKHEIPKGLLREARLNGKATHEGWRVRKDGTRFWGSTVITALHDDDNQIIGYSKVTRDLTERKIAEDTLKSYAEKLEQNNAELEQFAYVASHDLKEPLRKIITFGDLLEANSASSMSDKNRDYITRMQSAAKRMMNLIEDLLSFSKINRQNEGYEVVDLNEIITQVVHDMDTSRYAHKPSIRVGKLPKIVARKSQMGQLFQNLISNSLKFNDKQNPEVLISAELSASDQVPSTTIRVKDNGIGFEELYKKKIFDIFQRLHGRSEYTGSGIGLAICKKIVESHGGRIAAESEPGLGATFFITLPLGNDQE